MIRNFKCKVLIPLVSAFVSCSSPVEPLSGYEEAGSVAFMGAREAEVPFCIGADVSWLTQMEADGIKFRYTDGREGDCMSILKSVGVNSLRFRVWVDPSDRWNGTEDVTEKCRRAKELGMPVMVDFHYSDSWADPSKQSVPSLWSGLDLPQLEEKVGEYTRGVLDILKNDGIDVKWVQIGNETGNGMLWPYGKADSSPSGYAKLNNAGYDAVKSVYPDAKVIVHVQNGQDVELAKWLFGVLKGNGGKFDVAGFSLYPEPSNYSQYVDNAAKTMQYCIDTFGCDVMLCEVGMGNSYTVQCKDFLKQCILLKERIENDRYLGLLYWEPQVYNDWQGYKKGAFTSKGSPSEALDAFKEFSESSVPMLFAE